MKPAFSNSGTDPGKGVYFRCIPLIGTNKPNEYSKIVQVSHMKTIFKSLYFVIVYVMRYCINLKELDNLYRTRENLGELESILENLTHLKEIERTLETQKNLRL